MLSSIKKIKFLITSRQKLGLVLLTFLLFIGMVLEVFGLGILVPVITVILDTDVIRNNTFVSSFSEYFGIISHIELVFSFLLIVLSIYLFKTIFLVFLTFKQDRFLNNITAKGAGFFIHWSKGNF